MFTECLQTPFQQAMVVPRQFHELTPSYAGAVWMASAAFAGQWQRSVATEHSNGGQWTSVSTSWHHEWIVCMDNPFSCLGEPFFPFANPNKMYKCTGNLNRNIPVLSLYWNHIYHLPGSKYWSTQLLAKARLRPPQLQWAKALSCSVRPWIHQRPVLDIAG